MESANIRRDSSSVTAWARLQAAIGEEKAAWDDLCEIRETIMELGNYGRRLAWRLQVENLMPAVHAYQAKLTALHDEVFDTYPEEFDAPDLYALDLNE
jgi:hypothetical protein